MHWYRFEMDHDRNPYSFIDHNPMRADGQFLHRDHTDRPHCTLKVGAKAMMDVANTVGGILLLSERGKRVCESVRMQEGMTWSPIEIRYRDKKTAAFWALTGNKRIDALDIERSEMSWLLPGKVIGTISRLVLDEAQLPELDIFVLDQTAKWIVSQTFRDKFEHEHLTGAVFHRCDVSQGASLETKNEDCPGQKT
ncbi:MAG: hypothetical protein JNM56_14515 [Planctomycetia bacterium]|nr:hypothetical protein [Planctomycetia bacterium]